MKPTFAMFLLAALAPCLVTLERIATAATEAACEAGCEKACCAEKSGAGKAACCAEAANCEGCTTKGQPSQTNADAANSTATAECSECKQKSTVASSGGSLKLSWLLPLSSNSEEGPGLSSRLLPRPWLITFGQSSPCATSESDDSTCSASACTEPACGTSACTSSPLTGVADSAPAQPCDKTACEISKMRYAAIPAAVPSPFANGSEFQSAPALATQAYAATLPLQAPPAPVTQTSVNVGEMRVAACPKCTASAAAIARTVAAIPAASVPQVLFNVNVIEDTSSSLSEFESLQGDMPFLTADSEIVLATLRILEKQALLRPLSNPRLVTTVGQKGLLQIGTESPSNDGGESTFNGLKMEVAAREFGGGLEIEFSFCETTGRQCYEVATSLLLAHGQTVVMKACHPKQATGDGEVSGRQHPVYIVVTPQLLK